MIMEEEEIVVAVVAMTVAVEAVVVVLVAVVDVVVVVIDRAVEALVADAAVVVSTNLEIGVVEVEAALMVEAEAVVAMELDWIWKSNKTLCLFPTWVQM